MDGAPAGQVVASERPGVFRELLRGAERQHLLERRIEPGLAPDEQIEPLIDQRHEIEPELACGGLEPEADIGAALGERGGEIEFRTLDGVLK